MPDTIDHWLQATRGALSPNTQRALRSDLKVYLTWCQQNRLPPWPAQADHLVRFIHTMASHKAPATVPALCVQPQYPAPDNRLGQPVASRPRPN